MIEINKSHCGDCMDLVDQLDDNSIDLIVTSPPYFNSSKKYQRGTGVHYSKDVGEPLYTIVDISEKLFKKIKDDGFYCLNLGFSYGETGVMRPFYIAQRLLKQGWFAVDVIIWHKNNPIPIQKRLTNAFEYIFVFAKHPLTKYPSDLGYKHNVFKSPIAKGEGFSSAPFPIDLPKFCIEVFSKEGDLVLDNFMGSGTTALACKQLNRNFIGFEINQDYIDITNKRLSQEYIQVAKNEQPKTPSKKQNDEITMENNRPTEQLIKKEIDKDYEKN